MTPQVLFFVALAAFSMASLVYAVLQPSIAKGKKTASRLNQYSRVETSTVAKNAARDRIAETAKRRKTLQNSLKDLDDRQKERTRHTAELTLKKRIEQAGLVVSQKQFIVASIVAGFVSAFVMFLLSGSLVVVLGSGIVGGFGLPRFAIGFLRKRRLKKFTEEFPNAVDLVVRGVKSGLPVNDTFRMVAGESAEPVRSEFRKIVEAQQIGLSLPEAVERLYQNVPLAETNFFAIVIAIQAQAGGNLSEALGNLSRVLRDRRKMKAKVQAMSMEAKSSAGIIGSLPVAVAGMIYLMTPDYIMVLFTSSTGHLILGASALWMLTGIFVMRKMINFDI